MPNNKMPLHVQNTPGQSKSSRRSNQRLCWLVLKVGFKFLEGLLTILQIIHILTDLLR